MTTISANIAKQILARKFARGFGMLVLIFGTLIAVLGFMVGEYPMGFSFLFLAMFGWFMRRVYKRVELDKVAVLDTETTGLDEKAEICEVAIVDGHGNALLNTLVKPTIPIPAGATAIHGITNKMVADAPPWLDVQAQLEKLLTDKKLYIYNAEYDLRLIEQSLVAQGKERYKKWCAKNKKAFNRLTKQSSCIMRDYSLFAGVKRRGGGYRWHKLEDAAKHFNIPIDSTHRALPDCKLALGVLRGMSGYK